MSEPTCEHCGKSISIVGGDYRVVGLKRVGRSWPCVYTHRGDCERAWREAQEAQRVSNETAQLRLAEVLGDASL